MAKVLYRPKTMLEIYKLLPEGTPVQLINNHLYMSPAPSLQHFEIIDAVVESLKNEARKHGYGKVIFAPVDVFLGDTNAVQPDVFFIAKENDHIIHKDGIYGAPDIVVEVLSPANRNDDLVKKKNIYEKFGVKEYFIIEPSDKSVITYYLREGEFTEQKKTKGKLISKLLKKTFSF